MKDNYYVTGASNEGNNIHIDLTKEEFELLVKAKKTLSLILNIEEKYDFVISNFFEFEHALLGMSLKHALYFDFSIQSAQEKMSIINLILMNILTSTRSYLDNIEKTALKLPEGRQQKKIVTSFREDEFNMHEEYRFVEYLRNYVQHSPSPSLSLNLSENIKIRVKIDCFKDDEKSHQKHIKELLANASEINLVPFIRQYVQSISIIHGRFRDLIEEYVKEACDEIDALHHRHANKDGKRPIILIAHKISNGKSVDKIDLNLEWDDIRKQLQSKNCVLADLSTRIIISNCKY